jgi:hydrogenase 3 maturation protease
LAELERLREVTISPYAGWKTQLRELLTAKVAFVGVGHPLRGDDYVGSFIVKAARKKCGSENVGFFDAEYSVESIISKILDFHARHVVFVDACEMNREPGHVALIPVADTDYPFFTTHGIPLKLLADQFLKDAKVWVLAIQPAKMEATSRLSPKVYDAAVSIAKMIVRMLKEGCC